MIGWESIFNHIIMIHTEKTRKGKTSKRFASFTADEIRTFLCLVEASNRARYKRQVLKMIILSFCAGVLASGAVMLAYKLLSLIIA